MAWLVMATALAACSDQGAQKYFETKGFEVIHMSAPPKGTTGDQYLQQMADLLSQIDNTQSQQYDDSQAEYTYTFSPQGSQNKAYDSQLNFSQANQNQNEQSSQQYNFQKDFKNTQRSKYESQNIDAINDYSFSNNYETQNEYKTFNSQVSQKRDFPNEAIEKLSQEVQNILEQANEEYYEPDLDYTNNSLEQQTTKNNLY